MCGAVTFQVRDLRKDFGACHCEMCRRWTGSAFLGITVPEQTITFEGTEHIATLQSSPWAERAWCSKCGTGLWYRVTAPGPMATDYEIPIGLLHDADGLRMTREIYIDKKPDSFAYEGEHKLLTRSQVLELYAGALAKNGIDLE